MAPALPRLSHRYLLVVPVAYFRDAQGGIWLDPLWARDLGAHLAYLTDVRVLAPQLGGNQPPPDWVQIAPPEGQTLNFTPFGAAGADWRRTVARLPRDLACAWRAVGGADLIHSGVAGWPVPPGMIVNPIAVLRRRPLIMVVESAFWRLQDPAKASGRARLRARLTEVFARWSLRRARLAVYTTVAYRDSLPVGRRGRALVLPASWISARDVLSRAEAEGSWHSKTAPPRFLLASRLTEDKGAGLFLQAMEILEARAAPIMVDVMGEGPCHAVIAQLAMRTRHLRLSLREPIAYGPDFLRLLREYHAVIVPTTGDEQPRIIFDAFSQGVPVIATDTAGNRQVVESGVTGMLVTPNSAGDLATGLTRLSETPGRMRDMGLAALETARGHTHEIMHAHRADALYQIFGPGG